MTFIFHFFFKLDFEGCWMVHFGFIQGRFWSVIWEKKMQLGQHFFPRDTSWSPSAERIRSSPLANSQVYQLCHLKWNFRNVFFHVFRLHDSCGSDLLIHHEDTQKVHGKCVLSQSCMDFDFFFCTIIFKSFSLNF